MSVLVTAQDFEDLAWEYFLRAKSDGVVHAEVFFDPQAHTSRGVGYRTVVDGFIRACKHAERDLDISTRLILCFLRHLPVEDAIGTFKDAEHDLESGRLAGIGLDSSEKGFPPGMWRDIYRDAQALGIRRTAHAGEEGPVAYIREALEELDVQRIDHGICLGDDDELLKEVARRKILVTMCPISNVKLQCVKGVSETPIRKYLDADVAFSVNSDDPAYFRSYIMDNYCAVQEAFDLTIEDWDKIARRAVQGSWCDENRKASMIVNLDKLVEAHKATI
ncbi:MAG: hypothetical protein LQ351_003544 [Letrouitia transgressa]|nr:MAG: hypothetical protein LQ351_003544 [Letrouitia transgressa]